MLVHGSVSVSVFVFVCICVVVQVLLLIRVYMVKTAHTYGDTQINSQRYRERRETEVFQLLNKTKHKQIK